MKQAMSKNQAKAREISLNLREVKDKLYDATEMFFKGASVTWVEQMGTKPKPPYVTLKVGAESRNPFPCQDEESTRYYQCSTVLEVNLYSKGKALSVDENVSGNYENTSVSDMSDFVSFLESDYMTDFFYSNDMSIQLKEHINNLSGLENETRYRYRAMAEFDVTYTLDSKGAYGTLGMTDVMNSSGGGSEELRVEIDSIDNVDIEEEWR